MVDLTYGEVADWTVNMRMTKSDKERTYTMMSKSWERQKGREGERERLQLGV